MIHLHIGSRRHKNGDVSVPFCSVETELELCRLPFYHLHTAGVFPFRVGQPCASVLIANVTLQYAMPMPVD